MTDKAGWWMLVADFQALAKGQSVEKIKVKIKVE